MADSLQDQLLERIIDLVQNQKGRSRPVTAFLNLIKEEVKSMVHNEVPKQVMTRIIHDKYNVKISAPALSKYIKRHILTERHDDEAE